MPTYPSNQGLIMEKKLVLIDCDGTLTDGKLYMTANNDISLCFHVHDGMILSQLTKRQDVIIAIISGGKQPSCGHRAAYLNIKEYHPGVANKSIVAKQLQEKYQVSTENTIAIGDDINDIEMFSCAKVKIAVANAHPSLKKMATWVTEKNGGEGAVREALDRYFTIELKITENVNQ